MEIADLQEFVLSVFDPLRPCETLTFWAVPVPTAIEAMPFVVTLIAALEVAPKRCRTTHLDGRHDAPLHLGHRRAVIVSISFPIAAETRPPLPTSADP
jgi:hypothetical protein